MRIAIIGDEGYIGQNLRNYFEYHKYDVQGYDKKSHAAAENITYFNCDFVIMLAAFPGVKNCMEDLDRATIDNISAAFNVFRVTHNQGIKNLSCKYNSNTPVIFISSQAAKFPDHSRYGTIKRMIEIEADRYNIKHGDIRILRFTNVYGGIGYFQKKSTVIANIVKSIREEKEFIINGDGSQVRDFIHVDDICKAIHATMNHGHYRDPIDIGTGVGTSILDLVKMFQEKNKKFLFTFDKKSDMIGPSESIADIETADYKLGFKYHVKLQDWIDSLTI